MFITIFFITLDSAKRTISYASAGHNPMILYRKDSDSCYFLNTRGMPLGIALPDGVSFEDSLEFDRLKLKKDDMLVHLYRWHHRGHEQGRRAIRQRPPDCVYQGQ